MLSHLIEHKHQKYVQGIAKNSSISTNVKIMTIMNKLMAIRKACSFAVLANIGVLKYCYEIMFSYEWPVNWIVAALHKVESHSSQSPGLWKQLIQRIQKKKLLKDPQTMLKEIYIEEEEGIVSDVNQNL